MTGVDDDRGRQRRRNAMNANVHAPPGGPPVGKSILTDMDGVLVVGRRPVPGAPELVARLLAEGRKFLVLTNNSMYPPVILAHRLQRLGLDIPAERLHTSALATAQFLGTQQPRGTAYVIGEDG